MLLMQEPLMEVIGERTLSDKVLEDRTKVMQKIDALDLTIIRNRLCLSEDEGGRDWTPDRAKEAEKWYKRFLKLHVVEPDQTILPTKDGDQMWHEHILDTRKYEQDCQYIFGYFLHHGPSLGGLVEATKEEGHKNVLITVELHRKYFREAPVNAMHWTCWNNCSLK